MNANVDRDQESNRYRPPRTTWLLARGTKDFRLYLTTNGLGIIRTTDSCQHI
jgi:hypothetical protein